MARVKMAVARARRIQVISMLCERGAAHANVSMSINAIAKELGLTYEQVRSILRAFRDEGYVRAFPRTLPNGGTVENAYRVTLRGRKFLEGAESTPCDGERRGNKVSKVSKVSKGKADDLCG